MSKIDEIMGAVGRHGDDCIRDADAASASFEGLRDLIAAALADAERKGAAASGRCGAAPSAARSRRAMPCTTMATCAALLARCLSVVGVTR